MFIRNCLSVLLPATYESSVCSVSSPTVDIVNLLCITHSGGRECILLCFFKTIVFMYLFLATLGLQCFMQAFFVIEGSDNMQSSRGMVFLVAEHGLQVHRLK